MSDHVDTALFIKTIGSLRVLVLVAKAFLGQLAPWLVALNQSSDPFDAKKLSYLLHKMKGSCYSVAAFGVAEAFESAEASLPQITQAIWMLKLAVLKKLIVEVELELRTVIIVSESSDSPGSSFDKLQ